MASTRVLVLGLDPRSIPGYDPEPVVAAIDRGQRRFAERGISCHLGLVPLDDSAEGRIAELLQREPYECVVIGGGIRKEEELLGLFEVVVNLARRHAPQAAVAFNSGPDDSADAAQRWIAPWPRVRFVSLSPVRRPDDLDAVRESYDRVADTYVEMVAKTELGDIRKQPWMRAAIDVFADAVVNLGPVLDAGCGPGTVTGYLAGRGLDVSGVDLSPRMIDCARHLHPNCNFTASSVTELELAESSLGGVIGWWSLFNLPRDVLPQVLSSFARALVPDGQLIIGFHVGNDDLERTEAYGGIAVSWTTYQWQPAQLVALVEEAGLELLVELRLAPWGPIGPGIILVARRAR